MSDTCIVCLGKLDENATELPSSDAPAAKAVDDNGDFSKSLSHSTPPEDELVACLQPCGHYFHNDCLKPWIERTNSCPICRRSFNLVELTVQVGGA